MTSFQVNHSVFDEVNAQLRQGAAQLRTMLAELNQVLRRTNEAASGLAVPLWQEYQAEWDGKAKTMNDNLDQAHLAAIRTAQAFRDGDNHSGRIMGG